MNKYRLKSLPRCLLPGLVLLAGCSGDAPDAERFDLLIVGGTVIDGRGTPAVGTNIGITGARIVSIDASANAPAAQVIGAGGLLVVPGFIDPHTHALDDLLGDETKHNLNYLMQGATTVVVGNDGGGIPNPDQSLATLRRQGVGTNVAFYAGHNDIREQVMGLENRPADEDELEAMRDLVSLQMQAGALGLSTGLYYTPGSFASTEEVIELARVAARDGGIYDTHMRDESSYSIGLLGAVEEVIAIAEAADIAAHIAHLKALGRDVWGQSGDVIARIEAARERGLAVTADQYPYRASGTRFSAALIPAWVRADSEDAMFARLGDADLADAIREEMAANLWRRGGAESLLVTAGESRWRGRTLDEIAAELGIDPLEAAVEVVRDGDPSIASFNMNPDDLYAIAIQDWVMTGSDGSAGHPRKYGTYPTAYREFVVEQKLMSLERFVRRSSGLVADTLGLCDRGYLEAGRMADVVILDADDYRSVADFRNPAALATGVVYAIVNGELAVENGRPTNRLAGDIIDRQSLDCPTG